MKPISSEELERMVDALNPPPPRVLRMRRPEDCRCEALRTVFGCGAPAECGPCALRRRYDELQTAGFIHIPEGQRLQFQDCGVPTATTIDHQSWAPAWAVQLVDMFYGSVDLQPILCRAAIDHAFAEAVLTIVIQAERDPAIKVRDFAIAQGVPLRHRK